MSVARGTLKRAEFFAKQAGTVPSEDRATFQHFLEAAIVFARSVTFHLQKEFSHSPGFDAWYSIQQAGLKKNALAAFLLEARNYSLKAGPVAVQNVISIYIQETVVVSDTVSARFIRGTPWYRTPPRVLIQDATRPMRDYLRHLRHRVTKRRPKPVSDAHVGSISQNYRFADEPWTARPALEYFAEYLTTLELIVSDAEMRFT